jgi:hypothetical protein
MWGISGNPLALYPQPQDIEVRRSQEPIADRHLQSTKEVAGYHIQAADGSLGHVRGFQVDPVSWAIQELVVETGPWHLGEEILISTGEVDRISNMEKKVLVKLTKADIRSTAENDIVKSGV